MLRHREKKETPSHRRYSMRRSNTFVQPDPYLRVGYSVIMVIMIDAVGSFLRAPATIKRPSIT